MPKIGAILTTGENSILTTGVGNLQCLKGWAPLIVTRPLMYSIFVQLIMNL